MNTTGTFRIFGKIVVNVVAVMAMTISLCSSGAGKVAADTPPTYGTFSAVLSDNTVQGNGWPLGDVVTLSVDDPSTPLSPDYTESNISHVGWWDSNAIVTEYDLEGKVDLEPGFVLTMTDNISTKTLTIVNLQVNPVDPATYIVSGIAPAGTQVEVRASDKNTNDAQRHVAANIDGHWVVNFSVAGTQWDEQTTVTGEGWGYVSVSDADGDSVQTWWRTIQIGTFVDDFWVWADNWSLGTLLTMTISGPDLDYSAQAIVDYSDMDRKNSDQTRARFDLPTLPDFHQQAGDVITITDGTVTKSYTIKPLRVTNIDVDADTISGIATPGAVVRIHTAPDHPSGCVGRWVTADAAGHWFADFHTPGIPPDDLETADLKAGDGAQARENDEHGNQTIVDWGAPNPAIEANITGQWITTREYTFPPVQAKWPLNTPLTLTIDDPSNGTNVDYTETATVEQDFSGWQSSQTQANFAWPAMGLQPGYIVTVSGNDTTKTLIVSPLRVNNIDVQADTISGIASPGARIEVCVNIPNNCIRQYVTADGSGNWLADYHNPGTQPDEQAIVDIQLGTSGSVGIRDEDGDQISADWHAPDPILYANLSNDHQDDSIWSMGWPPDVMVTLEIDDPETMQNPDYTATQIGELAWWISPTTYVWFKFQGMFELQPGYFIKMSNGTFIKTLTVKDISITGFDVSADTISGIAVPEIQVDIYVDGASRHVMPDTAGNWTADFAQVGTQADEQTTFDIMPGIIIGSHQADEDGDYTVFNWRVPENQPPEANAGADQIVFAGETITLDASASSDPDRDPLFYEWDLDNDGQYDDADGVTLVTSFNEPGIYEIGLFVTDNGGLSSSATLTITVLPWDLRGFYRPVDMNGVYNLVKGGSTVPLKFEIFAGTRKLTATTDVKSLTYAQTSCEANAITDEIEALSTGGTMLRYDAASGQFIYNWKTPNMPGKCFRITVTTMDGSSLQAYFKLK